MECTTESKKIFRGFLCSGSLKKLTIVFEGYVNLFGNLVAVADGTARLSVGHLVGRDRLYFPLVGWTRLILQQSISDSCDSSGLGSETMSR